MRISILILALALAASLIASGCSKAEEQQKGGADATSTDQASAPDMQ